MKIDLVDNNNDTISIICDRGRRIYIDLHSDHMMLSTSSGKLVALIASDSTIRIDHVLPNIKSKKDKVK